MKNTPIIQTIQHNWLNELKNELRDTNCVRIVSPFVTENIVRHLLDNFRGTEIQLITRYNLNDFYSGVSSIPALEKLLTENAKIKGIKDLHSKLYLFDQKSAIITSANFTNGGFFRNKEFGIKTYAAETISESISYFNELWEIDKSNLSLVEIEEWKKKVQDIRNTTIFHNPLPDYGKSYQQKLIGSNKRYFIKFFGKNETRVDLTHHSRKEIEQSCCHYALSFSRKSNDKRPRKYRNGDVVFMAKMIHGNDYAIFGKGYTLAHDDNRDIAGIDDQQHVSWIFDWPILVRVYDVLFLDTTMSNCPKMSELISDLDYSSFKRTMERHQRGYENIKPWNSLRQQADIWLSDTGAMWLEKKFNRALAQNGQVPDSFINQFYRGIPLD
ncbi:phospholipase D family protein [Echinicola marina]|uniref:phospholipase D family protein n=1 Tax=Echinicola marina TaxID=2859768 RepID=UPI001CF6F1C5|nr:phospholipase D family protein [Echinicola marina]UCS93942.1 phospholipase D family protein [Echinicola marina]